MADKRKSPVHEMSREAANLLLKASDSGVPVSEAELRDELGVGHDDLRGILDQLVENGQATEVTPGEWSGPDADGELPRVTVAAGSEEEDELDSDDRAAAAMRRRDGGGALERVLGDAGGGLLPTVRLTRAIADALDAEALGKLVKAGISDTADEDVFVLEVVA